MLRHYIMWFTATIFFCYQYIIRLSPGVMVTELRHDLRMTAEEFSSLGAFYLYAYALLQLPLGVLIDRIGVRRTLLGSLGILMLGIAMLAVAETQWLAKLSRIVVGIGSASAFMSSLKLSVDLFEPGRRGLLMGITLTMGTIGALVAGKPVVLLLESIGWRETLWVLCAMGAVMWLVVFVVFPRHDQTLAKIKPIESFEKFWQQSRQELLEIVTNRKVQYYGILAVGLYTPLSVLIDLWGPAFVMQKYDLPRSHSAAIAMMGYLGLAIGSIVLPWLSERADRINHSIQVCSFIILGLFCFIVYGPVLSAIALNVAFITLGLACGAEMMCFAGVSAGTTSANSGKTMGVVNTVNMLGAAILQQLIGKALDWQWSGALDPEGIRVYSTDGFHVALAPIVLVIAACCLVSLSLESLKKAR
jgi:MFS family permease